MHFHICKKIWYFIRIIIRHFYFGKTQLNIIKNKMSMQYSNYYEGVLKYCSTWFEKHK